ncbi:MAG: sugar ABC transporter substrate-binding protein [Rhodothermaceae bacterium]|nr:MAG: sugar ABC transporter substrate-binding protein [Rhodothermaceae bacterium]
MRRSIVIPVLLALLAGGCAASREEVVEIDFWAMGAEGDVVARLLPDFEREHPGIRVRVQPIPWASAHEKLLTAFAGDATPDLCQLGNTWIPEFAALGALEDLTPWIDGTDGVDSTAYFPGIWETNVIDGAVYGIPWYVDTRLLFYRTDLLAQAGFDHPPRTWDEWTTMLAALKRQAGSDRYAILLPVNEFEPPIILALQQPDPMLRDGGRYGNFESPGFRRAFTFYTDMFRHGWAPKVANTQVPNVWQEFARGYFTFYITGPWNIGGFRERLPAAVQDDWMTAPMPGPGTWPGTSVAGGSSLVMFRDAAHKPEAWALIAYLSRPETQVRFHELLGNLPARREAWDDSVLIANPYARAFREQLAHVKPTPKVPEWERIATLIRTYAEAVVFGRMTVDRALAALNRDVDALLEKRRWMLARREREGGAE